MTIRPLFLVLLFSFFSTQAVSQDTPNPEKILVRILQKTTGYQLCSGIVLDSKRALTARHCFADARPEKYQIKMVNTAATYEIASLEFLENESRFFPNMDLAIVRVKEPFPTVQEKVELWSGGRSLQGSKLEVWSSGVRDNCLEIQCAGQLKKIVVSKPEFHDGFRLKSLLTAHTKNKGFCAGDSGAPLLVQKKGRWFIVGVLNGLWDPLTSESGPCSTEAVFTALDTYKEWLTSAKGKSEPGSSKHQNWVTLDQACRGASFSSPQDLAVQALIVEMLDRELVETNPRKALRIYKTCEGLDELWKKATKDGQKFKVPGAVSFDGLTFMASLSRIHLEKPEQAIFEFFKGSPTLIELAVQGTDSPLDLAGVALPKLKVLSLKHVGQLLHFREFLLRHPGLESIELVNIEKFETVDRLSLSTFAPLKNLRSLSLGMIRVEKDFSFDPNVVSLRIFREKTP
jgi:hypothetical protein